MHIKIVRILRADNYEEPVVADDFSLTDNGDVELYHEGRTIEARAKGTWKRVRVDYIPEAPEPATKGS